MVYSVLFNKKRFVGISHSIFLYFVRKIHSFIHPFARVHSCFLIVLRSVEGLPGVPSQGFELRPAVQQADALLIELRRTLFELLFDNVSKALNLF